MTVDIGAAEVDDALHRRAGGGIQDVAGAVDIDPFHLLDGRPVGHERTAVQDVIATLGRAGQRRRIGQVPHSDLHPQLLQQPGVAVRSDQAADRCASAGQALYEVTADEAAGSGHQADVVT